VKKCGACKLDLDLAQFSKCRTRPDGLSWRCRDCDRGARQRWLAQPRPTPAAKLCPVCLVEKPSGEFYKNSGAKDGLTYQCSLCVRAHVATHNAALPESTRRARRRADYEKYKPERLKQATEYRQRNKPAIAEMTRRWKRENPARVAASEEKRRARKKSAESTGVTPEQWTEILECFNHCCAYCLKPGTTMDHFRPLALAGLHAVDNVVPACRSCNPSKGDDLIFVWLPRFEQRAMVRGQKVAA
jgi:5-methylcytosine-specific restriction endonuclease McrA